MMQGLTIPEETGARRPLLTVNETPSRRSRGARSSVKASDNGLNTDSLTRQICPHWYLGRSGFRVSGLPMTKGGFEILSGLGGLVGS